MCAIMTCLCACVRVSVFHVCVCACSLLEPRAKHPPLVTVDVTDTFGRTALHWACFLAMQNSADFLIGQGADPELRALPSLDTFWGTGIWDSRLRSTTQGEGKKLLACSDGSLIGPTPLEVCFQVEILNDQCYCQLM